MIPPDRCPRISLSEQERVQYDRSARKFLLEAMVKRSNFNSRRVKPSQWSYVRKRGEVCVYRSVLGAADPAVILMLGTGLLDGSLEDVMNGLYCDNSTDLFVAKVLLGYPLAEGSVLNASEVRSSKDPFRFAGIKWFACKGALGFMTQRDVLTYERMGSTLDGNGNELAYHTLQSIRRPEWPTEATPDMQRQHTATCYLYRPRPDVGKTEVFLWGSIYKFGGLPEKLIQLGVASTWLNVVNSPKSGLAKKFSALADAADAHQWPPSR
ncbi:hypothetical protein BBJ28_00022271 [Nothophytophthora sp. Chile5]|nr:hypothetical protein BBJ28_00022271 [Nothophytophthora sp. Chile5]